MRTAGLVILLALGCAPLDRSPPFGSAGYVDAVEDIGRSVDNRAQDEGAFVAGWARQRIDIPPGAPLAGFGDRDGAPNAGIADDIYVRAFVVGTTNVSALIFTADLLLVDPRVVEAVAARLDGRITADRIFYTASHTHSGLGGFVPGVLWTLAFGPYEHARFEAVVDAHVQAATAALDDVAPASIGTASVRVTNLIKNRVERNGPVDETLQVTRFERIDGRTSALWIYGCHAVTRNAENLKVSADYPGDVARNLEGDAVQMVAFAAGGVGSSNPRHERKTHTWISTPLTSAVRSGLAAAKRRQRSSGRVAFAKSRVRTPDFTYRVNENTMILAPPIEALVDMPTMTYGAIAIDRTVLLFMPGEMSGELTAAMRGDARRKGVQLAVTSFNGTYTGYIVSRRVYDLDEEHAEDMLHYETRVMSFFGLYGGDIMVNLGIRLARGVYGR